MTIRTNEKLFFLAACWNATPTPKDETPATCCASGTDAA